MVDNITDNKSNKIMDYITCGIFMAIGIAILAGGVIYTYTKWEFKKNAVEISATIVDIQSSGRNSNGDRMYTAYVNYEYEGLQYEYINLGSYSSNMYVGKEITLLCDPDNPYKIDLPSGIAIVSVGLTVMGLVFIAFSTSSFIMTKKGISRYEGYFIISRKGIHRYENLLETGKCVMAKVDYVEQNTNITSKERHPFIIHCTYTDMNTGKQYSFKSPNLYTDTDLSFVYYPGMMIPVYVNENNYNDYMMDTESLISNTGEGYT